MSHRAAFAYIAAWSAFCLGGLIVFARSRRAPEMLGRAHLRALLAPWKLVLFGLALAFFVAFAPYSGDPTWDRIDGTFMSVLTYLTAPWSVGVLYRSARNFVPRALRLRLVYVALVVWLFSASFSYDLYIFLRDGFYPSSWASNIVASSVLYLSAGMLFSLHNEPGRGVIFDFMAETWPSARTPLRPAMIGIALVFVLLVVGMMAPFLWDALGDLSAGGTL